MIHSSKETCSSLFIWSYNKLSTLKLTYTIYTFWFDIVKIFDGKNANFEPQKLIGSHLLTTNKINNKSSTINTKFARTFKGTILIDSFLTNSISFLPNRIKSSFRNATSSNGLNVNGVMYDDWMLAAQSKISSMYVFIP